MTGAAAGCDARQRQLPREPCAACRTRGANPRRPQGSKSRCHD